MLRVHDLSGLGLGSRRLLGSSRLPGRILFCLLLFCLDRRRLVRRHLVHRCLLRRRSFGRCLGRFLRCRFGLLRRSHLGRSVGLLRRVVLLNRRSTRIQVDAVHRRRRPGLLFNCLCLCSRLRRRCLVGSLRFRW